MKVVARLGYWKQNTGLMDKNGFGLTVKVSNVIVPSHLQIRETNDSS